MRRAAPAGSLLSHKRARGCGSPGEGRFILPSWEACLEAVTQS